LHLQHGSQREGPYKRNSNPVMWRDWVSSYLEQEGMWPLAAGLLVEN
jgi:hypothetical protein